MPELTPARPLSPAFDEALIFARAKHIEARKGTDIPYISHLLAVASLLLDMGSGEDEVIAGLLHDVVEDCDVTIDKVSSKFGPAVGALVAGASEKETVVRDDSNWRERKSAYIDSLDHKDGASLRVSLADKIANLRTILIDSSGGDAFWERFNSSKDDQYWNYSEKAKKFTENREKMGPGASPFVDELNLLVERMRAIVGSG